jgi:hypothetical protein
MHPSEQCFGCSLTVKQLLFDYTHTAHTAALPRLCCSHSHRKALSNWSTAFYLAVRQHFNNNCSFPLEQQVLFPLFPKQHISTDLSPLRKPLLSHQSNQLWLEQLSLRHLCIKLLLPDCVTSHLLRAWSNKTLTFPSHLLVQVYTFCWSSLLLIPSILDAWSWNALVMTGEMTIGWGVSGILAQVLNGALTQGSSCVSWGSSHGGWVRSYAWSRWLVLLTCQQGPGSSVSSHGLCLCLTAKNRFSPI